MCDVCQNVHNQIRKYQQCQEESQQFVLTKGDVMANVLFPVSWNHRQCLCCFKETKNYEAYNNIIQMVINIAVRLLHKYNDDPSVLKENVSVVEMEAQCENDADDALWSMLEFEQLLIFISSSLVMSFPLYIICKHNHICGVEELSTQETNILATYCDVSDAESLPVMLLRNVCFFCDSGGPQSIKKCLEVRSKELTIPMLGHIVHCLANLKHWLTMNAIESYISPLKQSLVKYMCSMTDDKLRQAGSRNITELAMSLIKEPNPVKALFDKEYLKLSFKYFSSSTLTIRMAGLQQLNSQVALFNEALSIQAAEELEAAGVLLAEWLVTNRIIEHIFGPNLHNELVKQSQIVLNFLASEGKITVEHIDTMWSAAMQKHCSRQVLDVLILLVKHLSIKPLVHMMDLLHSLDTQAHTEQTLMLVSSITEKFWSIPSREERQVIKLAAAPSHDTSQENEISVCSSEEEESEDSNEEYEEEARGSCCKDMKSLFGSGEGDAEMLERPKRSLPVSLMCALTEENPVQVVHVYGEPSSKRPKAGRTGKNSISGDVENSGSICESTCEQLTSDSDASPMKPAASYSHRSGGVDSHRSAGVDSHCSGGVDSHHNMQMLAGLEPDDVPPLVDNPLLPVTIEDLELAIDASGDHHRVPTVTTKLVRTPPSSPGGSMKSDKNMADFDGEDYMSEEELMRIGELHELQKQGHHHLTSHSPRSPPQQHSRRALGSLSSWAEDLDTTEGCNSKYLDVSRVTEPGHTLLWDLIQDDTAPCLPEGLIIEAEKLLSGLLCTHDMSLNIKLEFIQACINNINLYKSSTISLKLLPKLISSFQHPLRTTREMHDTTLYIEETYTMMTVFFVNLVQFRQNLSSEVGRYKSLYGLRTDINVRLHFLSFIYSYVASPESFCLNHEQIDIVWKCLAMDKDTSDHVLNWLYTQVTSREFHALSLDAFKYIYTEKLTQLNLKDLTMTGFNLFHLLHEMLSQSNLGDSTAHDKQLWDVALKSQCTEVSLAAIDYLNNCYMSDNDLSREPEFIDRCMKCLLSALETLHNDCETSMQVIDRGLYLLKNHIESFRHKYAFQLKMWQLRGGPVVSHQCVEEKGTQPIKLILSAPSLSTMKGNKPSSYYKVTVDVLPSVLLGELRADVTSWWHKLVRHHQKSSSSDTQSTQGGRGESGSAHSHPSLSGKTGAETPHVRMMANQQELGAELDKKTLHSLQIKNDQIVIVSVSSNRAKMKQEASIQLPLVTHLVPMMILVQEPHFENLFNMLQVLSNLQRTLPTNIPYRHILCNRARVLSRRVWELLMAVPTNPSILQSISKLSSHKDKTDMAGLDWELLLQSTTPSKLIYSLQIVESLSGLERKHKPSITILSETDQILIKSDSDSTSGISTGATGSTTSGSGSRQDKHLVWSRKFIMEGGLLHLFSVLADRKLEEAGDKRWSEWHQEALAYLLRLLCQFAVIQFDEGDGAAGSDVTQTGSSDNSAVVSPAKRVQAVTLIPKLNKMILDMIESRYDDIFNIIYSVIYESVQPSSHSPFGGRLEVIHQAMVFLVYWAYSDDKVEQSLKNSEEPTFLAWLKRLTLLAAESQIRQEACKSLYRLCVGQRSSQTYTTSSLAVMVLSTLLELLPIAVSLEPLMCEAHEPTDNRKSKIGVSCQDYLWLTSQLLDNMDDEILKQFDLNKLAELVRHYISSRRFYEQRHSSTEDEGLIGLLNLQTVIIKHNNTYKNSSDAQDLLTEIFDGLFLLPCIKSRHLPKCKSNTSRCAAYDLLVELAKGSPVNYSFLHSKLIQQHDGSRSYPWDYWPMEDVRSVSGFVGLQNLGATCYMATCMQHLYMIPQARQCILSANCDEVDAVYAETLREMKKMFAYLMESERKSFNPTNFCKVYEMDRQPLNTGEQKDMTEFFTDLITKLEEMSPPLKSLVKTLFGGVTSNNVVSLDCPHVSCTLEEFYTIRCQVADMKTLYESLDEVCVKDTLDGDNMYTCSKCQKKVRAEKRACFKKLPKILCFNTMRYTFNMVTMLKEKINTHFSFPQQLNMADYMESNLLQPEKLASKSEKDGTGSDSPSPTPTTSSEEKQNTEYELIGITVHTGTADGGHYYSFIRDKINCEPGKPDKWFLFNDSEVKPFDPAQIAQECFGGEMTNTTYDTIADKFVDFSFEKTNSAYMLFYERIEREEPPRHRQSTSEHQPPQTTPSDTSSQLAKSYNFELSNELADWIWKDNTTFLQDKNIFCHNYFGFMWQMCAYIPTTLPRDDKALQVLPAQLSSSFLLETFIHAKEKPTMVQWIELLTKQFNQCPSACEWLLEKMTGNDHWSKQILIGCGNQTIRQMFQRLIMHVITQIRNKHYSSHGSIGTGTVSQPWLLTDIPEKRTVVSGFICKQLQLLEQADMQLSGCRYLAEYFTFLYEFARLGAEEKRFLLKNECISIIITFYLGGGASAALPGSASERSKSTDSNGQDSSDDDEDDVLTVLAEERFKVTSLEKMINIIAILVESSRVFRNLQLSDKDMDLLVGGKGMKFIVNQIKDNINPRQTCQLIFSLCRWNEELAMAIVNTILHNAVKSPSPYHHCQAFLKVLTMTTELPADPPGHPHFTELILSKFWLVCESKPLQFLEWMSNLVCHNPVAHGWMLERLRLWVEPFLLKHAIPKVRTWAMLLLVSLVPSQAFRNFARTAGQIDRVGASNELTIKNQMSSEALSILHDIYMYLLELMPMAKQFADVAKYGTTQLVSYLTFLSLCLLSKEEKLMFSPYFPHLWQMFQPKMTDPQVAINQNKQSLLVFWYHACVDCPENVTLIINNTSVTKNVAFNYILADHDDQDVVAYNRCMLPAYYAILKICCQRSRLFTRHLATHQNMIWAFQHIVPFPSHYSMAVDELLAILQLIVTTHQDVSPEEEQAITTSKHKILAMYQHTLNPRNDWQSLVVVLKILLVNTDDVYTWVLMSGLASLSEAFSFVHGMYHEATACHVLTDICDCLSIICRCLKVANDRIDDGNDRQVVFVDGAETTVSLFSVLSTWEKSFLIKNCLTLLNSYSPSEVRSLSLDALKKLVHLLPETVVGDLASQLLPKHVFFQAIESPSNHSCMLGPYLPTRPSSKSLHPHAKINVRPSHPQFGMFLHHNMLLDRVKGQDAVFDQALSEFYMPYHIFVDFMVRVAVNKNCLNNDLVNLSALVAYEGIHLHSPYFAKLWCEIYQAQKTDKDYIKQLCQSNYLIDYMEAILHDERSSLNNQHIYQFFTFYFKLVHQMVLCEETNDSGSDSVALTTSIKESIILHNLSATNQLHYHFIHKTQADLRALLLIYKVQPPTEHDRYVIKALTTAKKLCIEFKNRLKKIIRETTSKLQDRSDSSKVEESLRETTEVSETEDKKSPGGKSSDDDQQVPTKKRKVSPPHTATSEEHIVQQNSSSIVEDPSPKVTIEHRPAPDGKSASSNKQIKGSSRSNSSVNKGKGPAKKPANRPGPRSMVKSSGRQQTASASAAPGVKSSRSNSSTDDSDRESAVHQSAAADSQLISSGSSSRSQRDTTAGSRADTANVEVVRARKRLEQADHVLDLIGALLAIVESLEPDE